MKTKENKYRRENFPKLQQRKMISFKCIGITKVKADHAKCMYHVPLHTYIIMMQHEKIVYTVGMCACNRCHWEYICTYNTNKHLDMQKCVIEQLTISVSTIFFLAVPCDYNFSRLWCTMHTRDTIYIIGILLQCCA